MQAPALPARNKSVDQLLPSISKATPKKSVTASSSINPDIEEYYAHLGKHVKEVRRRKANNIAAPSLSDFRVKKDDKVISTNWTEFIQAVSCCDYCVPRMADTQRVCVCIHSG